MIGLLSFFRRRKDNGPREMELKIAAERHRIRQSVQVVRSGSRVMRNMAGMMHLMSLNEQLNGADDD